MQLFATGAGAMSPPIADGALVTTTPVPAPLSAVSVTIGGQTAAIEYAGAAPQLVAASCK